MSDGLDGVRPWWRSKKNGFIYVVRGPGGRFKIGKTTLALDKRLRTLITISPVKLTLVHSIVCKDCHSAEKKIHARFKDKRIHGEWFSLSQADVDWIKAAAEESL